MARRKRRGGSRRTTYRKKASAKKAAGRGRPVYKVKGGYRVGKRRTRRRR